MPPHNEIKAYTDSVAAKYGAHERITYHTEVIRAEWHDDISRWRVRLRSLQTKEEYTHECKLLYSCAGALVVPNWPDIEGLSGFQGEVMHSARWRHDVDLEGKRVAVFGNGCKSFLFIPFCGCRGDLMFDTDTIF